MAKSIFDLYETNRESEEDGKWFDEEFGPEVKLKLRRYNAKVPRLARDKAFKPHLKAYKTFDKIPEDVSVPLTNKLLAETIVVDWKGIFDRDGNEIPFSKEAALDLFTKLPDFATAVILVSVNADNYRAEDKDEIKGN